MGETGETIVLLTGFGAFPGARTNPTMELVRRLNASRRFALQGIRVEGRVLPVVYGAIENEIAMTLARVRPAIVVHMGLAARRKHVSVETRAVNRLSALRPDAARRFATAPVVVAGGPAFRAARWPAARLVAAMSAAAPTRRSIDAGDYLCNQLLYLSLGLTAAPAGFIHVPRPRGRTPKARLKAPRPTLAAVARAVEAAILVLSRGTRRLAP